VNVLLIGPRGCGKTTIGCRFAARTQRSFVDLDENVLERFAETSVSDVWSAHGEAGWRRAEAAMLQDVLRKADQVVALGGGTPMIDDVRQRITSQQRAGSVTVVYLQCDVDELARRLARDGGDRPSLTGADPIDEIRAVLAARAPTYRRLADVVYDVTEVTPEAAAEELDRLV
jgi:shikimate kinase